MPTALVGKILYLAAGSDQWIEVANDLNYASGVGVSPEQKSLYVSETVGNCLLKFAINQDGSLGERSNFVLLNLLTPDKHKSWWLGPDSMKIDHQGNIYVAQWFGGKILKISPEGKLLHVCEIRAGDGTTNVAFGPRRRICLSRWSGAQRTRRPKAVSLRYGMQSEFAPTTVSWRGEESTPEDEWPRAKAGCKLRPDATPVVLFLSPDNRGVGLGASVVTMADSRSLAGRVVARTSHSCDWPV